MGKIVVVDAVRSAVGRAKKGSLANRRPDELAGEVADSIAVGIRCEIYVFNSFSR